MTKKEIATMVAETINGLEAGMAMVGEKDGQPSVIIGKESVRPSFNVTDDIANHVNACKNEDVYVALAEVAADMRAQYNVASKANPVTRDNILKTAKVCLRRAGSGKETDVVKPFAQGIEKYIRVDASCVQEDSSFVLADAVCKVTGVTLEEAWLAAEANVAADVNIMSIMDVLKEKGLLPADMEIEDPVPMLVVTNAATSFGAGVITSRRARKWYAADIKWSVIDVMTGKDYTEKYLSILPSETEIPQEFVNHYINSGRMEDAYKNVKLWLENLNGFIGTVESFSIEKR